MSCPALHRDAGVFRPHGGTLGQSGAHEEYLADRCGVQFGGDVTDPELELAILRKFFQRFEETAGEPRGNEPFSGGDAPRT